MPLPFERFESVVSQKVATVVADGSLRQFAFNVKNMNQHWLKLHQQNPADGTFKIICRASNKVIDAAGENLAIHTHLQQFVDTGSINQRWKIVPTDEDPNVFFIKAIDTNRVWDVPDASLADGVQLQLFQLHGGNNQRW